MRCPLKMIFCFGVRGGAAFFFLAVFLVPPVPRVYAQEGEAQVDAWKDRVQYHVRERLRQGRDERYRDLRAPYIAGDIITPDHQFWEEYRKVLEERYEGILRKRFSTRPKNLSELRVGGTFKHYHDIVQQSLEETDGFDADQIDTLKAQMPEFWDNAIRTLESEIQEPQSALRARAESQLRPSFQALRDQVSAFYDLLEREENALSEEYTQLREELEGSATRLSAQKEVKLSSSQRRLSVTRGDRRLAFENLLGPSGRTVLRGGNFTDLVLQDQGPDRPGARFRTKVKARPNQKLKDREHYRKYQKSGRLTSDLQVPADATAMVREIIGGEPAYRYTTDARIGGVSKALKSDEAINLGQLEERVGEETKILGEKAEQVGIALAALSAMLNIPGGVSGKRVSFGFSIGSTQSYFGVAAGLSFARENWRMKGGLGYGIGAEVENHFPVVNAGISYSW